MKIAWLTYVIVHVRDMGIRLTSYRCHIMSGEQKISPATVAGENIHANPNVVICQFRHYDRFAPSHLRSAVRPFAPNRPFERQHDCVLTASLFFSAARLREILPRKAAARSLPRGIHSARCDCQKCAREVRKGKLGSSFNFTTNKFWT